MEAYKYVDAYVIAAASISPIDELIPIEDKYWLDETKRNVYNNMRACDPSRDHYAIYREYRVNGGLSKAEKEAITKAANLGDLTPGPKPGLIDAMREIMKKRYITNTYKDMITETARMVDEDVDREEIEKSINKAQDVIRSEVKVTRVIENAYDIYSSVINSQKKDGIKTGIEDLDRMLSSSGLIRGHITIVGGATSSGKSALSTYIALGALKSGHKVMMVTLEDDVYMIMARFVSMLTGLDTVTTATQKIDTDDTRWLSKNHPYFLDSQNETAETLIEYVYSESEKRGVDLIIWDYVQLIRSGYNMGTRQLEIDYVFGELTRRARKSPCATLVISQLKRTRGKAPTKEDLYHSGAIEQWAHTIILIHKLVLNESTKHYVKLIVDKQKNGPVGACYLLFNGSTVSYEPASIEDKTRMEMMFEASETGEIKL